MTMIETQKISGKSVWKAADFDDDNSWLYPLSKSDIAVFDQLLITLAKLNISFPDMTKADISLGG